MWWSVGLCFLALHVSDVSFPGLHPLCWYMPSWHQTTEFTSWSRNCCAEVVWFWQVGSWLWDFNLSLSMICISWSKAVVLRKITRSPKVPDHEILSAWHNNWNKKIICFLVAKRQKLVACGTLALLEHSSVLKGSVMVFTFSC